METFESEYETDKLLEDTVPLRETYGSIYEKDNSQSDITKLKKEVTNIYESIRYKFDELVSLLDKYGI
jgi:hypothetical protein